MRTSMTAAELADRFGMTARYWTRMAVTGKVPGAWQPSGAKGKWLFDKATVERWQRSGVKEVKSWRGYISAERRIGAAPSVREENIVSPSAQKINQLLKSVCANG